MTFEEELYEVVKTAQTDGIPMTQFLEELELIWIIVSRERLDSDLKELHIRRSHQ